jgi:hypothetical protein
MKKNFVNWLDFDPNHLHFSLGSQQQNGKHHINMFVGPQSTEVAIVTPACVTNWPRVTGDGNFGTMWGPADVKQSKFTLDLTSQPIGTDVNANFDSLASIIEAIDDRLLSFVHDNQWKVLKRNNLSREEVRVLQIRSVKDRTDKCTGRVLYKNLMLSISKFAKSFERKINVCDHTGKVLPNGNVAPGDVVAVTMYANQVYTGVGGDKFGIQWGFQDVQVVCQRACLPQAQDVAVFGLAQYDYAHPYVVCDEEPCLANEAWQPP